ncbi:MAG: choice-of-anchor D domain-containing protein [Terracidiphilus sp.]
MPISFAPTEAGSFGGTLALTDNALNVVTTQSILLNGTGTGSTPQTISFGPIPAQTANSTLALIATASSGLPVTLTSTTPGVCTVLGSTASLVAAGTCNVQASQSGSPVYAAAAVTQSFTVSLMTQTITFAAIPAQSINTAVPVTLVATSSSGLPVSFTSTTPATCTVSATASTATLLAGGICTIQASQPGDGLSYAAAPTVTQSFTVQSANPVTSTGFGSVNIGSTSSANAVTLTFNTASTLGGVSVLTQGATGLDFANAGTSTCNPGASYNAAASCTVNVTFAPVQAGNRYGSVVLVDNSGNVLATSYLQGTGVGPQLAFLPGTEIAVPSSTLASPTVVAVDASGNAYIADSGNNRVLKETLSAGSYTESTVPTSVLAYPSAVAVDGSGNVYIADYGNNRVLKETLSAVGYTESTVPTSALSFPSGVAVDGSGNVYIADTYNNRVLLETLSSGSYTETTVPTSSLNGPSGVAVDGNGNVYIADTDNDRVLLETLSSGSYTESSVPTSALSYPSGVSVDGSGNLYIADAGNNRVLKEMLSAGSYAESIVTTGSLNWPSGIAVSGNGNVYIADTYNNRVLKEDVADPPSLNFVSTAPSSTSSDSPQTVTVENIGNAALSFPVPGSGGNPSVTTNFSLGGGGPFACSLLSAGSSTAATLAAGQSCLLPISFAPTAAGAFSGSLVLTDNTLNAVAAQSIPLSGTGTGSTQQTITFGPIPAQPASSTLGLSATASSGLPVSLTSTTPAICTVSGSVASLLAAGICTIQASQPGTTVYAAAPPVTQSFTVSPLTQTIAFAAIQAQAINTAIPVTLNATASSNLPVSLTSTTPLICAVSVSASTATLLADGSCTIQASQAGNSVYAAAPTVAQSFTVLSAPPPMSTNFGTMNIGSTSSPTSVPVNFNTAATLSSVSAVTQGASGLDFAYAGTGTCSVGTNYNAGDSCTVNATFTPAFAGTRYGAVLLADGSGNVVGTTYLQGTGVGPQLAFLPGTEITVPTSALSNPSGVAVDASGNIYIADAGNNRVLKESLSAGGYTESTVPSSVLGYPSGVAVDGSGNVYIADTWNGRVLKETLSSGSYAESTIPTSALNYPSAVAVDGSGNVYISDQGNNRILAETLSSGNYTESAVPTSALAYPSGVAVDGSGNVYIADQGNNRILVETLSSGSYTESTVPTSTLYYPDGVAVDGSGNLYIADSGNNRILVETVSLGSYTESTVPTSTLNNPEGVAVDGSGNVYIADTYNNRVLKEDLADPPSLSFAFTSPGSTSSPQTLTIESIGNTALNFPIQSGGANPSITANFALNGGRSSTCQAGSAGSSSSWTLAAGQSCVLSLSFAPTAAGTFSGSLLFSDNSLNVAATQSIPLSGTTDSVLLTITFAPIPPQPVLVGLTLLATASSGLTVSFTSTTPTTCALAGSFAFTKAAGTCTILATQAGNTTFAAAPAVSQSFAVSLLAQTITFSAIPAQVINTSAAISLSAMAGSWLPISFTSTTPAICMVSGSTASLLAPGTCTIQANQPGDGIYYAAAPTVTQSFTVVSAGSPTSTNFGAANIGSLGPAIPVQVNFNTAATLGSVSVLTEGASGLDFALAGAGTCTAGTSYNAGDSCTVNATFAPTLPGDRYGAVVLSDGSGNVLATSYLQGKGVGSQVNFLPNTENTVPTSALSNPSGVAVDASGNIYIADTNNNRVLKETYSAGGYTESTVPTSPLSWPYGVAVDGSGNIYIADTGNNWVLKETLSAGSYTESTVPTSNLNYPFGVAVDGSGNVYIADTDNYRVLKETLSEGSYIESIVPTSPLGSAFGVAVDGNGNVYISDTYNYRVLKEALSDGSYREIALPTSGLSGPYGIAVDGNGNVYIVDYYGDGSGNSSVYKETLSSGSYTQSTVQTSSLNGPFGVAVDGSGNVYIADTYNNRVLKEDFSDPPSLSFAATTVGSTSSDSPQTVTVENAGNAVLTFPAPNSGSNPSIAANYTLGSSGASACPLEISGSWAPGTLAAGQSCLLSISFAPAAAGDLSGSLALTDNALNAAAPAYATQTIQLSGSGTQASQAIDLAGPVLPAVR